MGMDQTIAGPMRAYLLGLLADDKASALEEEYFVNRAVLLRLQSEERALIADYLDGRLRSEEKRPFESRYLKMPELQRKVNEARSQHSAFRPAAKPWTRMMRPVAAGAAFAMVLCLGIGVWAFYHWEKKPAQQVAQVQPAEPTQGGTESAQATHGDTGGQGSLLPESNPVVSGGATLEFHMGQPLFIASSKSFLVGDRGPCAISNGDVLLRTASIPYENNTAYVSVVRSKPGDCKADTYLQVKVRYLEEMHQQFQERAEADMRRLQALAKQASPQNADVAVNTPAPVSASPPDLTSENNKPVEKSASSPQFSMLEQLKSQYTMTEGLNGCHVINPESAFVVQSPGGGLRMLPDTFASLAITNCTNHYADGKLKPPSACKSNRVAFLGGWVSHERGGATGVSSSKVADQAANQQMDVVATGEKVYPENLAVDENKGEVKFFLSTCKESGGQKNPYKGELVFHFKSLKPEDIKQVEDAIGQVLRQGRDQQGNWLGQQDNTINQGQQNQGAASQGTQSASCNPEIGQTIKQVTDSCGQPDNQTKGATKTQFFYNQPKIKVIFVDGKVSDIE
jgi:hypothetical protein